MEMGVSETEPLGATDSVVEGGCIRSRAGAMALAEKIIGLKKQQQQKETKKLAYLPSFPCLSFRLKQTNSTNSWNPTCDTHHIPLRLSPINLVASTLANGCIFNKSVT